MLKIISKKIPTIIVIFIATFILISWIDLLINQHPPRVIFVDKDRDSALSGKIFVNNVEVGESNGEPFTQLPDIVCKGQNEIAIEIDGTLYSWPLSKEDCKENFVAFILEKSQTVSDTVLMKFFVKETQQPLLGELYFNNEFIIDINGEISIDTTRCKTIQNINLTSDTFSAQWLHHTRWCDAYAVIEYSVPQEYIKQSGLGSVIDVIANQSQQ